MKKRVRKNKTVTIQVRVSAADRAMMQAEADQHWLSLSAWARWKLLAPLSNKKARRK